MLQPKRAKYRRHMKNPAKGNAQRGTRLELGDFGIKVLEAGRISSRQIESARKAISFFTKKGGRLWIRVFPDKPITLKPAEVRMGGGKGPVDHYAVVVKPGRIIFELGGVTRETAAEALRRATEKIPLKTRIILEKV